MSEASAITTFTPWESLLGGALIGLSAVILMVAQGRIAGVSGILAGLLPPVERDDMGQRLAFVVGLVATPLLYRAVVGSPVVQTVMDRPVLMIAAGLLVGFGVVWGNGCTSGHGVCGIARLSPRSIVATLTFMSMAIMTVVVTRHVAGNWL